MTSAVSKYLSDRRIGGATNDAPLSNWRKATGDQMADETKRLYPADTALTKAGRNLDRGETSVGSDGKKM